jgi:ribulose-phosphate 3-epimerase
MVLLMSVNPGFGGQSFIPEVLPKIRKVKEMADSIEKELEIEIDGGVNSETAKLCMEAGANVLVAGSAIYNQEDYAAAISLIRG